MSTGTAWADFTPVTDQDQIDRQAEQLSRDFDGVTFEAVERLSAEQQREYNRLALEQAQRHGRRADALERHVAAHRDRADRLGEEARPVEIVLSLDGAFPELVERKAPADLPADARVNLTEAARRIGVTTSEAVIYLGLAGHCADDAGTFRLGDVDDVKDAR